MSCTCTAAGEGSLLKRMLSLTQGLLVTVAEVQVQKPLRGSEPVPAPSLPPSLPLYRNGSTAAVQGCHDPPELRAAQQPGAHTAVAALS